MGRRQSQYRATIGPRRPSPVDSWRKHMTLSSRDLIWDSCDGKEHLFMSLQQDSKKDVASSSLFKMQEALAALPGSSFVFHTPTEGPLLSDSNTTCTTTLSSSCHSQADSTSTGPLPRFRRERIMDHDDVELCCQNLRPPTTALTTTSLLRANSSDSFEVPDLLETDLYCSESLMESQQRIMNLIQSEMVSQEDAIHLQPSSQEATITATTTTTTTTREEILVDGNGSKVRIHDQQRVYTAMDQGMARVIQCIGCMRHMMATQDSELIYCPSCGTLNPAELARIPSNTRGANCPIVSRR